MSQAAAANEKSYILGEVKPSSEQGTNAPEGDGPVAVADTKQLVTVEAAEHTAGSMREQGSSMPYTSFNYINSIIGSGIIGMPYALRQAGFWFGLILMLVVAGVTDYSLVLMVRGGRIAGSNSYQDLVEAAFGRPGFYILSFMQFVYPFIAMISYNVIIGDTTTKVLLRITNLSPNSILGNRNFIVALATLLVTLPLSLYKQMAKLAKISFVSLVFIVFIMVAILVRVGTLGPTIPPTEDAYNFANTGITQAIGIMTFAFMCHHNTFLIYGSLSNPTEDRWNKVTHISIFTALITSIVFGVAGYVTFTGLSQGDVLENYCLEDDLMNVARFLFGVTIMLTYPLECFVTREVVDNLTSANQKPQPQLRHFIVTVIIVVLTVFVSMATDCLGIVLELNGVLAAVPLAYIMPALCYLKLEEGSLRSRKKLPALMTAAFGIVVAVSGLVMIGYSFSEYISCSHGERMAYCLHGNTSYAAQAVVATLGDQQLTTASTTPSLAPPLPTSVP